ncbi:MAG: 2-succinyl-6-hydroxy-2,4-cyclohexadiene-1-carboxylate synthase [Ardenticatenales bacterium]|nr:2-succinyl-6-hydroxy-2,4-cyclohexadiene-1-carboxylate synthase [Ardenticatenales bacterium]
MAETILNGEPYHFWTGGSGRPLLLLHGFTGSGAGWEPFRAAWGADYQLIAPDILGHGRSAAPADPARYTMAAVAADMVALLDHLGLAKADLLGYSMGGRLALYLVCHYPDRFDRLILESSSPGLATETERASRRAADEALADRLEAEGIEAFVARWEALSLWASQAKLPADVLAAQRAERLAQTPRGLANSLRGMGTGAQPSLWGELEGVDRPVLLINGALDQKFVAINEQMAPLLPYATLKTLPDAGHNCHLEQPAGYATLIARWLAGAPPT